MPKKYVLSTAYRDVVRSTFYEERIHARPFEHFEIRMERKQERFAGAVVGGQLVGVQAVW